MRFERRFRGMQRFCSLESGKDRRTDGAYRAASVHLEVLSFRVVRDARMLSRFRRLMSRTDKGDLKLFLFMAQKMSQRKKRGNRT